MQSSSVASEVLKSSPAVAYASAAVAGVSIADWVTYLTLTYVVLQLILLIPKYVAWYQAWRTKCPSKPDSCKLE
jgi:hypothetical protein